MIIIEIAFEKKIKQVLINACHFDNASYFMIFIGNLIKKSSKKR